MPSRFALAAIVAVSVLAPLVAPGPVSFMVLVGLFGWGGWRLGRVLFRPRTTVDAVMVTWTVALAWFAVASEVLSAARVFGQPWAWLAAGAALALVGALAEGEGHPARQFRPHPPVPARDAPHPPAPSPARGRGGEGGEGHLPPGGGRPQPVLGALLTLPPAGRLLLLVFVLQLGTAFVLTWFTGIAVSDANRAYLPRSLVMLQEGTVYAVDPVLDFLQHLHEAIVAVQLLFLRSDILVNVFSFVVAAMVAVGLFAFVRSVLPAPARHDWLPLATACLPFTMPIFLLHASVSNFDVFEGQWLLYALYFLRRGYAATNRRWLLVAAVATGLALGTKPTFWFALPGLAALWAAVLLRPLVHRRGSMAWRRTLVTAGLCLLVASVVGAPFLARNLLVRGFLVASPARQEGGIGAGGPADRLRLLGFNTAALGLALLVPPALLPPEAAARLDRGFALAMQAVGYRLPDPALTAFPLDWPELIRHAAPRYRYDSNHAGFGAAFVLVVVPGMMLLAVRGQRLLGPRRVYLLAAVLLGLTYFLVLGVLSRYSSSHVRYLNEMVILLAAVSPCLFLALPGRLRGPVAVAVAGLLLVEMHGVVRSNRQMPPDRVIQTPRIDQSYLFAGDYAGVPHAARVFRQNYPPSAALDVWVHDTGEPNFPIYTFWGPTLERRLHRWGPASSDLPPGPLQTEDQRLVERLTAGERMVADRLAAGIWLLLPNDRLRVRLAVVRPDFGSEPVLRLAASVPPGRYQSPLFGLFLIDRSETIELRPFGPDPILDVPLDRTRRGAMRVVVRDGPRGRDAERVEIAPETLRGLEGG